MNYWRFPSFIQEDFNHASENLINYAALFLSASFLCVPSRVIYSTSNLLWATASRLNHFSFSRGSACKPVRCRGDFFLQRTFHSGKEMEKAPSLRAGEQFCFSSPPSPSLVKDHTSATHIKWNLHLPSAPDYDINVIRKAFQYERYRCEGKFV